jgi:hypothetical protein
MVFWQIMELHYGCELLDLHAAAAQVPLMAWWQLMHALVKHSVRRRVAILLNVVSAPWKLKTSLFTRLPRAF